MEQRDGSISTGANATSGSHRSDLLLFDALEIAKGPIATIDIPIRMRFGLHGNWAHAADIGLVA
jgi:carotenoid cleavage dioxygenase